MKCKEMTCKECKEQSVDTATHCNTLQHTATQLCKEQSVDSSKVLYGLASISRLLKIICLFCRISSLL